MSVIQFSSLSLAQPILDALAEQGYTSPTPIQAQAIPHALAGRDLLGCAQTGTGKTAAFALPILHRLLSQPRDTTRRGPVLPRALILSPTRELATQIADSFRDYGRHTGLTTAVIFGGVSQMHQERALRRGVDIIVATPGRLIDLLEQRIADLSGVNTFVLDEADRMLDMGFIKPIRRIAALVPVTRQTMLFSATLPREIMSLAESLLRDPARVSVSRAPAAEPRIEQSLYMVPRERKQHLLTHLLGVGSIERAVVFTKTKHGADRVARRLHAGGIHAVAIHGNKAQNQRTRALEAFRAGHARVLVATDVAARGLDVDGITHVFNYDLPMEPEAYVHRIGRTGRAGASGIAVSFCDADERDLLRAVERTTGKRIPTVDLPVLPELPPEPHKAAHAQHPNHPNHPNHAGHSAHCQRPAHPRPPQGRRPGPRQPHRGDGHTRPASAPPHNGRHSHGQPAGSTTPRPANPAPANTHPAPAAKPRPGFLARSITRRPGAR